MGSLLKRGIAWIGLLLVLFNLTAGEALPVLPSHETNQAGWDDVCTSQGMVPLGDLQGGTGSDHHARHASLCACCLPLLHGGTLSPPTTEIPAAPVAVVPAPHPWHAADHEPTTLHHWRPSAPRAPPVTI